MIRENSQKYSISPEEVHIFRRDQVARIKLPRYDEDCVARYFTIEDIEKVKFTTIEKLVHITHLQVEIRKKLASLDAEDPEPVKKLKVDCV